MTIRISIICVVVLLLSGCGRKKAVVRSVYTPGVIVETIEEPFSDISKQRETVRDEALQWLGVPYRYGGETRKGVDCSGFVMSVYRDALNCKLPRVSTEQRLFCIPISVKDVQVADLLFFSSNKSGSKINHVGISLGGHNFVHSSSSRGVIISSLDEAYYQRHFHSAGRIPFFNDTVRVIQSRRQDNVKERTASQEMIRDTVRKAMSE